MASGGPGNSAANKKRKKRKTKPQCGNEADGNSGPSNGGTSNATSNKKEASVRFEQALEALRKNSPESSWIELDNCNIHESKAKKIASALKANTTLMILNLSDNHIGDAGAKVLAEVLSQGGASRLLQLDLIHTEITDEARKLLGDLKSIRKELVVRFEASDLEQEKALEAIEPIVPIELIDVAPKPVQNNTKPSSTQQDFFVSSFLQRFFQGVSGGQIFRGPGAPNALAIEGPEETDAAASELWSKIETELKRPEVDVTQLSKLLQTCVVGTRKEMETSAVPFLSNTKMDELRPYTKQAVRNLELMHAILDVAASPQVTTFSRDDPVAALGSHVVMVAQLVERISYARTGVINIHIVKASLLPRLIGLCFIYPRSSALQSTCCRILRWAILSNLRLLWEPFLQENLSLPEKYVKDEIRGQTLVSLIIRSLQSAADTKTLAKRPCESGFAISIANTLYTESRHVEALDAGLKACDGWEALLDEGSVLHKLLKEQEGDLHGPRPSQAASLAQPMGVADELDFDLAAEAAAEETGIVEVNSDREQLMQLISQSVQGLHIVDSRDDGSDEDASDDDEDDDEEEKEDSED